ncbi:MAG: HAD family hydrolase, partial [Rhodospirillales bacterium]
GLAESKAREAAKTGHGSPEVSIDTIYRYFPTHIFGLDRNAIPALIDAEFQAEQELCFTNPDIAGLIREARARGLRVGFLSDTYWPADRLAGLLKGCAPDLEWDFLFASCDHGTGKTEALFRRYLEKEGLEAGATAHIGDNEAADIVAASKLGIQAVPYPQAGPALSAIFQRETLLFNLLCAPTADANRLDQGARTARRAIAGRAPAGKPAFTYGTEVLGPVMTAFDRFVADRVAGLSGGGRRVAVAFLGRDGLLPLSIWRVSRDIPVSYAEVNRRIALVGAAESVEPIAEMFRRLRQMNLPMATSFLKSETPRMRHYFKRQPGGIVTGDKFAEALPKLITKAEISSLTKRVRQQVLAHLRHAIPDFDACTDLALVDLGYSGTVQKSLRTILDLEGCPRRLHGLYLLTADDAFRDLDEADTAEGFLSATVISPSAKHALLKNISLLEQMCGDARGSVLAYDDDGTVQREPDPRPQSQLDLCASIRDGAVHFAKDYASLTAGAFADCFANLGISASWTGALLARALLLPTDDELLLLGRMKHDVNMGSQTLASMADPQAANAFALAGPLQAAFSIRRPPIPMWMAGSMAEISPLHGFLYALHGTGHLPADIVGDASLGGIDVVLIQANDGHPLTIPCYRDGFGNLRLHIPLPGKANITAVAIPASALPPRGIIRGVALQSGDNAADAMASPQVAIVPPGDLRALNMTLDNDLIAGGGGDGHLVVPVPPFAGKAAVMTVTVSPLDGLRLLALAGLA